MNTHNKSRKDKKEMIVCNECGIPLVWTFHWAYYEYYCLGCGGHWGMLGAGKRIKSTPELEKQSKYLRKLWKALGHYLTPESKCTRTGCLKCQTSNDHREHLSKKEIRENKIATKILEALKGSFGEHDYEDLRFK